MIEFWNTKMGRQLIEGTLPRIATALESLSKRDERPLTIPLDEDGYIDEVAKYDLLDSLTTKEKRALLVALLGDESIDLIVFDMDASTDIDIERDRACLNGAAVQISTVPKDESCPQPN